MNSKLKMERDFMGLAVKQEISDEIYDAAPVRSLPMQWSFSNNGSSLPQVLSFQEDTKIRAAFDSLSSIDPTSQKNMVHDNNQGAIRYAVSTTFPAQKNHAISSTSLHHQSIAAPSSSPVVGTTDLRSSSKISNSPAQLTIFFNGSVSVYDNISPEKAQAIMLLAGNGPPTGSSPTPSAAPLQPSMARSSSFDGFTISKTYSTTQNRSSPGPGNGPAVKNDATPAMPAGVLVSSSTIAAQPLKSVNPMASVSANFLSTGTVPQFRRKSLARFLEKRKERVASASPYGEIRSPDCSTPGNSRHSPVSAMN